MIDLSVRVSSTRYPGVHVHTNVNVLQITRGTCIVPGTSTVPGILCVRVVILMVPHPTTSNITSARAGFSF